MIEIRTRFICDFPDCKKTGKTSEVQLYTPWDAIARPSTIPSGWTVIWSETTAFMVLCPTHSYVEPKPDHDATRRKSRHG